MEQKGNRTLLLEWHPEPRSHPASGGIQPFEEGWWGIRTGNYITLGGLFAFGAEQVTCYQLYKMYLNLDWYCYRKFHSVSTKEKAVKTQNAKELRYQEHGHFGLWQSGPPGQPRRARAQKTRR